MPRSLQELLDARFGEGVRVPDGLVDDPGLTAIASHSSHRRFTDEPVPDDLLDTLLACALCAPSKSDLQQVGIVHVRDRGARAVIAELIPSMPWIGTAPVFLLFCGDNRRIRRICEMRGKPFGNHHLDSFFNAAVDAALVLGGFVRAAAAVGLGCCPVSAVRIHCERIAELAALPPGVYPVAGLAAGWPAREGRITPRLPLAATVHRDRYDDGDLEALVDAYDRRRHEVQPIAPDKQRLADRYGLAEFYRWSEDKARQVSVPEREAFGRFVRAHGFSLE